jgi:hypothetical protein
MASKKKATKKLKKTKALRPSKPLKQLWIQGMPGE